MRSKLQEEIQTLKWQEDILDKQLEVFGILLQLKKINFNIEEFGYLKYLFLSFIFIYFRIVFLCKLLFTNYCVLLVIIL